jgi:adenylosuccinate synthase
MTEQERHFAVVNGIAYGEESKGNTVQAVVRELDAHTVWRSGGWQGGHHIVHDDGREAALSFFGAGVFDGADTYLHHMVISPVELFQEGMELENLGVPHALETVSIHEDCLSTTPFHSGISRTREILRGKDRKGTIGKGVGEAIQDSYQSDLNIRAGDFRDRNTVIKKAEAIRCTKLKTAEALLGAYEGTPPEDVYSEMEVLKNEGLVYDIADACHYASELITIVDDSDLRKLLNRDGAIVNEVSHGALHHPRYGFMPHVTQVDPTSRNVMNELAKQNYDGNLIRLGVVRSYLTRHGAGPFMSYSPELTRALLETHNNAANDWLGDFKTGYFDIVALRYALEFSGGSESFDGLFVSYMDILADKKEWDVVEAYEYIGKAKRLSQYFQLTEGKIVGIKVHQDSDRIDATRVAHNEHQHRLTELLKECEPIVTTLRASENQSLEEVFLDYVTEKLDVPIAGTAYGPKVADRQFLPAWQTALTK